MTERDFYKKVTGNMVVNLEEIKMNGKKKETGNKKNRMASMRKTIVAASLCCVVAVSGVSIYATTSHGSLLSLFAGENKNVQKKAEKLVDKNVKQDTTDNKEQAKWAKFKVEEAICDNNEVYISIAVTATDAQNALLIPTNMAEGDNMSDLGLKGEDGNISAEQYAKKYGKKILKVEAGISGCNASSQSISNTLEEDGTLMYTIRFDNLEKSKQLKYQCNTFVIPPEKEEKSENMIKDQFEFTLKDKSDTKEEVYKVASKEAVEGTDLVIDGVSFTKSDLGTACKIQYHYTGDKSKWEKYETKDQDILFFMLDEQGNIIETADGGNNALDGVNVTEVSYYRLSKLPKKITFVAKDVMEKKLYGKFTVEKCK